MSPSVPEANILQSLQPFFRKLTHSYLGSCSQSALNLAEGLPIFLIFASPLLPLSQLSPFSAKSWVGQENERSSLFARSLNAHERASGSRLSATTSDFVVIFLATTTGRSPPLLPMLPYDRQLWSNSHQCGIGRELAAR